MAEELEETRVVRRRSIEEAVQDAMAIQSEAQAEQE